MVDSTNPRIIADNIKKLAASTGEIPIVEANPTGETTTDLEKLGVDGTVYGIPQGTIVEANPTGEATTDLEKLTVGETIYGIPKGGSVKAGQSTLSGGSSYTTITTAVAFQTPMADTNYAVTITQATADSEGPMYVRIRVVNKTVNGFSVECFSNETITAFKVDWIAAPYEPAATPTT